MEVAVQKLDGLSDVFQKWVERVETSIAEMGKHIDSALGRHEEFVKPRLLAIEGKQADGLKSLGDMAREEQLKTARLLRLAKVVALFLSINAALLAGILIILILPRLK